MSLAAAVAVVVLLIGGWQLYWKLHRSSVNREAAINQTSYNRQTALVDDINREFQAINVPGITDGQRKAYTNQLCDDWVRLTPTFQANTSQTIHTFVTQECS